MEEKQSVPFMARMDKSGASTQTVAYTCLFNIAQRLMEHVLGFCNSLHLGGWPLQRSAGGCLDDCRVGFLMVLLFSFFSDVEQSERTVVLAGSSGLMQFWNVCALYTTLQPIVSILPRRASWLPAWLHDGHGNRIQEMEARRLASHGWVMCWCAE